MHENTESATAKGESDSDENVLAGFASAQQTRRRQPGSFRVVSPFQDDDEKLD